MQIKRFEAKTMTLALHMIKEEFGSDAVILSARSVRGGSGIFGSGRGAAVEVTAAQDRPAPGGAAVGQPLFQPKSAAAASSGRSRGLLGSFHQGLRQLSLRRRPEETSAGEAPENFGAAAWQRQLLAHEVHPELVSDIIAHLQACRESDPVIEIRRRLGFLGRRAAAYENPPPALVLVGPAGVGKTTTAIKLAAGRVARRQPTALLTLDDRRIGAFAQLRIYADILGIPLAAAASADEVGRALERFGPDVTVIVDTPGISPGEEGRRDELKAALSALPEAELHLTLALNTREKMLQRTAAAWKGVPLSGLIVTRLDETDIWGPALNLALQAGVPLSYAAHGPRIPEDLAPDALTIILERLVPRPDAASSVGEEGRAMADSGLEPVPVMLVANRSSDLYHRPGCRWVRKIKPENLIRFAAPHEAESRNFMPCRNCNPDQSDFAADAISAEGVRLAGTR